MVRTGNPGVPNEPCLLWPTSAHHKGGSQSTKFPRQPENFNKRLTVVHHPGIVNPGLSTPCVPQGRIPGGSAKTLFPPSRISGTALAIVGF